MRRFLLPAIVTLLSAFAGVGVAASPSGSSLPSGPSLPTDTQQQVSADELVPVPPTHSCRVTLMTHDFKNSYGAPYNGTYAPPAGCRGPWAKVVLTLTSTVGGTQFDRDVYVAIGHAVVLDGTTSEPCCTGKNASTWTVQRDVTDITALLRKPQPVQVELDNVNDATYTGVYHTVVSLTFYATDAHNRAGSHPDRVLPVSSTGKGGPMLSISHNGQRVGAPVVFPRNLDRLHAQVFADSHGPCEEFWWGAPGQCGVGVPYREVAVYLDGRLAGAAPAYPAIYTGAGGPGLWEPIPAPRAWNLRPYDLDLTPFVGLLTDGHAHSVQLGILDMTLGAGDFWATAANLQVWTTRSHARTRGHLLDAGTPPNPTDTVSDPTGQAAPYTDSASHQLVFIGDRFVGGQRIVTRIQEDMSEDAKQAVLVDDATWQWRQTITVEVGKHRTVTTHTGAYSLTTDVFTTYQIEDKGSTTTYADHNLTTWNSYYELMRTADATGLVFNGVEDEQYTYTDPTGCSGREVSSQAGEVTVDQPSNAGCTFPPPPHQLRG